MAARDEFKSQHPFLYNLTVGIDNIAEKTGLAEKTRKFEIQKKSEVFEENILDPVASNTSLLISNWQFVVIGMLALLVLLRD